MDSRTFRNIVGHFATGVTVVTTQHDGLYHGMTANAFCSVSLDPLLVLVCVDHTAACHDQIVAAGRFGINVLAHDQLEVSNLCARRQTPRPGGIEGVPTTLTASGIPIVDNCIAFLDCELHQRHEGGDHEIFIGRVVGGWTHEGDRAQDPLLFFRGRYGALGDE